MRTIKLSLEYDGTDYVGWQVQPNGPSIQSELERALGKLLQEPVKVTGAGRTDAGVHARGQVASLRTGKPLPLKAFVAGANSLLPKDIAVWRAEEREENFDARRSARGKIYRYRIVNRRCRSPLERRYAWEVFLPLAAEAMREAAAPLLGTHDFSAFRASDCEAATATRELRRLEIDRAGEIITISVEATAFLKHMVRNLVGTLVEVGLGRREARSIPDLLASGRRERAGATAPPQGLTLWEVFYEPAPASLGGEVYSAA